MNPCKKSSGFLGNWTKRKRKLLTRNSTLEASLFLCDGVCYIVRSDIVKLICVETPCIEMAELPCFIEKNVYNTAIIKESKSPNLNSKTSNGETAHLLICLIK